jgi:hypothetical protein
MDTVSVLVFGNLLETQMRVVPTFEVGGFPRSNARRIRVVQRVSGR